uniref:Secreted protein n=1 Tax=Ixodes ricinus TaxID=34613 RepID=V5HDU0_IXORI
MLAATFIGVFIACFAGEITCDLLHQTPKSCNDDVFHEPGYAPGCKFPCTTGNVGEDSIQRKEYENATVCVEFKQRWSQLPELNKEFHRCETRNQVSLRTVINAYGRKIRNKLVRNMFHSYTYSADVCIRLPEQSSRLTAFLAT